METNLTSKNFAAIYARISGQTDNNSINAQIAEGKSLAKEHCLLIYNSYDDKTSGKSTAPKDRKGFKNLLNDATAGLFKTLIIYRYDRLVRNYDDWLETSSMLKKLGVRILLSDKSQPIPSASPQSEFLTNLTILFAELEPSNISSRSNKGKEIRRANGIYVSGNSVPLGYTKIASSINGCTSAFIQNPVEKEYIQLLFELYAYNIDMPKMTHLKILKEIFQQSYQLLLFIKENLYYIFNFSDDKLYIQYHKFIELLFNNYKIDIIEENINNILHSIYLTTEGKINTKTSKFRHLIQNCIYGGYMLKVSAPKNNPLQGLTLKNNVLDMDIKNFIRTTNLEAVINFDIFFKVHNYILKQTIKPPDVSPNFLFKGIIKCGVCKHKLSLENPSILSCPKKSCNKYFWTEIKELILNMIVDNVLLNNNSGFMKFKSILNKDLSTVETSLNKNRTDSLLLLSEYVKSNKFSDEEVNLSIIKKNQDMKYLSSVTSNFRGQLAYINTLENIISSIHKANKDSKYELIKKEIVQFISQNENLFSADLREILTEIKVGVINKTNILETTIKYKFTPDKSSNLYKSIYKETKK